MSYTTWVTADHRRIKVEDLTDIHLVNIIRAIEAGKVFPDYGKSVMVDILAGRLDLFMPGVSMSYATAVEMEHRSEYDRHRDKWLLTLKTEARCRNLDWTEPPTRRVGLCDVIGGLIGPKWSTSVGENLRNILGEMGIPDPELDVCKKTGKAVYLHWKAGENVGTPLDR